MALKGEKADPDAYNQARTVVRRSLERDKNGF